MRQNGQMFGIVYLMMVNLLSGRMNNMKNNTKTIAYKGFDENFQCRGFQYEIDKEYSQESAPAKCTSHGFHACLYPLDVFNYYPPTNKFAQVVFSGEVDIDESHDSKIAGNQIFIQQEISLHTLVEKSVGMIFEKVDFEYSASTNTGYFSASTNTGDRSASTNTGNYSASTNTGYCSASTNTGNYSASTNTGNRSASTNTGDCSAATNTGYCSASTNTGNYSASTNTGNYSASTNTGNYSASTVEGVGSVALAIGCQSRAKAHKGGAIVLIHRNKDGSVNKVLSGIAGVDIEADVWYRVSDDGELIKWEGE
jgi:hypothetical protein